MPHVMIMVGRFDESGTAYSEGGLAVKGVQGRLLCTVNYTTWDYDMAWRYEQTIRKGSGCM